VLERIFWKAQPTVAVWTDQNVGSFGGNVGNDREGDDDAVWEELDAADSDDGEMLKIVKRRRGG
jgi:hypothetical protein